MTYKDGTLFDILFITMIRKNQVSYRQEEGPSLSGQTINAKASMSGIIIPAYLDGDHNFNGLMLSVDGDLNFLIEKNAKGRTIPSYLGGSQG